MNKAYVLLLISLFLCSSSISAESLSETVKGTYKMAKCLNKKTKTMCLIEFMYDDLKKSKLKKDMPLQGQSKKYTVYSPNSNWFKVIPKVKRKHEDLQMVEKSKQAYVQVSWDKPGSDYKKIAQKNIDHLVKKFKDHEVPVEFEPYHKNGVLYEVCYKTVKKTEECIFSAAAKLKGGVVSFFTMTSSDEKLIEDIIYVLSSVEQAK